MKPLSFPDPNVRRLQKEQRAQDRELRLLDYSKANASQLGGLSSKVNALEEEIGTTAPAQAVQAVSQSVTQLSQAVAQKADAAAVATALGAKADAAEVNTALAGKATTAALQAVADAMPKPAASPPPAVQIDSQVGADERYALADHTHESRLQARRMTITPNAQGRYVYVFPKAYPQGTVPIVNVTAETPTGVTYRNDASLLENSTTNTQTTVIITRTPQTVTLATVLTNLLGSVITLFAPVTTSVTINIMSRAPS